MDAENLSALLNTWRLKRELDAKRQANIANGNPLSDVQGLSTMQAISAIHNRNQQASGLTAQDEDNIKHGLMGRDNFTYDFGKDTFMKASVPEPIAGGLSAVYTPFMNSTLGRWFSNLAMGTTDTAVSGILNVPALALGGLGKISEGVFGGDSVLTDASKKLFDWDAAYKKLSQDISRGIVGTEPTFMDNVMHGSGTSLGFMTLGTGAGALARSLWHVSPFIAKAIGYGVQNFAESLTEAGSAASDTYAQDKSRYNDALLAGAYSFGANAIPDFLQSGLEGLIEAGLNKYLPTTGGPVRQFLTEAFKHLTTEEINELLQEPRQQAVEEAIKKAFQSGDMSLANIGYNLGNEASHIFSPYTDENGNVIPSYWSQVAPETAASTLLTSLLTLPLGLAGAKLPRRNRNQNQKSQAQLIEERNNLINARENITQRINEIHQSYGEDIDSDSDIQNELNKLYSEQAHLDNLINNFWDDRYVTPNPVQDDDLDMFPDRDELFSQNVDNATETITNDNFDDVTDEPDDDFDVDNDNESFSQSPVENNNTDENNETNLGTFDFRANSKTHSFNVVSSVTNSNDRLTRLNGQRKIDIRSKTGKIIASFYPNSERFDFSPDTARKHSSRWQQKFQHDFLNQSNSFLHSAGWLDDNGNLTPDGNENFRLRWNERFNREGVDGRNAFYSNEVQPEDFDDDVLKTLGTAPNTNQSQAPKYNPKREQLRKRISSINDMVINALGLPVINNESYNQSGERDNQTVGYSYVNDNGQKSKLSVETAEYPNKYKKQRQFFGRFFNIKDNNGNIIARYAPYTGNLQMADSNASEALKTQVEAFVSRYLNDYLSKGGFIDENGKLISDGNEKFRHKYRTRLDTTPEGKNIHPNNQHDSSPIEDNRTRKQRIQDNEAEQKSFEDVKQDIQRKIEAMFKSWFDKANELGRELYHVLPKESAEYYATIYATSLRNFAHRAGMRIDDLYKVWNLRFDFELQDNAHNRGNVEMNPAGYDKDKNFHVAEKIIKTYGHIQDVVLRDDNGRVLRDDTGKAITRKFLVIDSDASTLLHEGSHIFLEDFRELMTLDNIPEQIKYDWGKLIRWLGVADIDLTKDKSQRTQDEQRRWENAQEKFAVAMEQYYAKGKAPNTWLKRIFKAFKSWLSDIYSAVKNIKYSGTDKRAHEIEIPKEIKRVFDRLLQDNRFVPNEANREARFNRAGMNGESETHSQQSLGKQNSIRDVLDIMHTELGRKNSGNVWVDYTRVSKDEAERISKATGLDINDKYVHTIIGSAVTHTFNRHGVGNEQRQDQLPITDTDFERIPDIIHYPDQISRGNEKTTGNLNDTIVYQKRVNGHILIVEEVRKGRKKLVFHTMRKAKAGYIYDLSLDGQPITKDTTSEGVNVRNDTTPEVQLPNARSSDSVNGNNTTVNTSNSTQKPSTIRRSNDSFVSPSDIQQFEQLAYHGTGHIILGNHFDLKFIGSGEGAQMFGYGIYLAQDKNVAQTYRHYGIPYGKRERIFLSLHDGSRISSADTRDKAAKSLFEDLRKKIRFGNLSAGGFDSDKIKSALLNDYQRDIQLYSSSIENARSQLNKPAKNTKAYRDFYERKINIHSQNIDLLHRKIDLLLDIQNFSIEGRGNIYETDVPENDVLLDWDVSINEQPQKVKRALKKVIAHIQSLGGDVSELRNADSGETFYKTLQDTMKDIMKRKRLSTNKTGVISRPDMAASLLLNQAGIPGLRYLDQFSRFDDEYDTHNFVIWNTDLIQITGIDDSSDKDAKEYFHKARNEQSHAVNEQYNQPVINELRTEEGHSVEEADPSELLLSQNGTTIFGTIDSRTANIAGIHEGNIVMDVQGLMHTKLNKHNHEIINAGYPNVESFFFDVLRNYDRIYQGTNDSLLLAKALNKHNGVAAIELMPDSNGTYLVQTGWIIRDRGLKNRKLLFSRSEPFDTSPVAGEVLQTFSNNTGENASHAMLKSNDDSLNSINSNVNNNNSESFNQNVIVRDKNGNIVQNFNDDDNLSEALDWIHDYKKDYPDMPLHDIIENIKWDAEANSPYGTPDFLDAFNRYSFSTDNETYDNIIRGIDANGNTSEIDTPQKQLDKIRKLYEGTPQWLKAPNGQPSNLSEKQWLQVRTPAFKRWFGDWEHHPENASKILDKNGESLVVFHGSPHNFSVFDTHGEGFSYDTGSWFSSSERNAESYGSNVYATFLNIRNPYVFEGNARRWNELGDIWIEDSKTGEEIHEKQDGTPFSSRDDADDYIFYVLGYNPYDVNNMASLDEDGHSYYNPNFEEQFVVRTDDDASHTNDIVRSVFNGEIAADNHDGVIFRNIYDTAYGKDILSDVFVLKSPNNIKSATDNNSNFDSNNNDIYYQRAQIPQRDEAKINKLLERNRRAEPEFRQLMNELQHDLGGKLITRKQLKSPERIYLKALRIFNGDFSKVGDVLAATLLFDSEHDLLKALDKLKHRHELVHLNNRWNRPKRSSGYRDINSHLRLSNGVVVELQLQLKDFQEVKDGIGHSLYEFMTNNDKYGTLHDAIWKAGDLSKRLYNAALDGSYKLYPMR